ncbi:MAG: DNA topoisomerase III, partial [Verrucomicrobiota bacterium]
MVADTHYINTAVSAGGPYKLTTHMSKKLIIAEKPSVALDLSRALAKIPGVGKFTKEKDYFESETLVISSAVGHLVELCMPQSQTGTKLQWKFEHLPIMPKKFELQPIDGNKQRLKLLIRLMKRKDVDVIINACDAGREGELIFRYVQQISKVDKPTQRMWMQSMTQGAIQEAFENMRTDDDMQPLANAAMCRSESDWLVGINGTRAMTAFNSKYGGFSKTPVGRVKTPTLAIMVEREKQIQAFESRDYWEVHADFSAAAGSYEGRWFDEKWRKDPEDSHKKAERLWTREQAEAIQQRCQGKPGEVEEQKKPRKEAPPLLYDLTTLQREASSRFGFSARRTLQIAQALYERYKVLTYPRTDSRYLPEDYVGTVKSTMGKLGGLTMADLNRHSKKALDNDWVKKLPRVFNTAKVSDHFAIIPTGQIPKSLPEAEAKLYTMVTQRFVAAFYPHAEFEITTRITRIDVDAFKTSGKILVVPGWQAVYGKAATADTLVPVSEGEKPLAKEVRVEDKFTKPPARYTEATILSAMEGAGKLVDDEELREAMTERGLGTPATRAATIEGLISDKYITRHERDLIPTQSGIRLIDTLEDIGIATLTSPEMTGEWEHKLKQMEGGGLQRESFMDEIKDFTTRVVSKTKTRAREITEADYDDLDATCPVCQSSPLKQDEGSYRCRDCKFQIWKMLASRPMSEDEIKELLSKGQLPKMTGFRSRFGEDFEAALEFDKDFKVKFITEASQERER